MNLKILNDSIVQSDAIERKAELGYIFVDLSMRGKVTTALLKAKRGLCSHAGSNK